MGTNAANLAALGYTLGDYAGRTRTVTRDGVVVATVTDVRDRRNPYSDTLYRVVPADVPVHVGRSLVDTYDVIGAVLGVVAARDAHLVADAAAEAAYVSPFVDGVDFLSALLAG